MINTASNLFPRKGISDVGGFSIEWKSGQISDGKVSFRLPEVQLKLLHALVRAGGKAVTKEGLLREIWSGEVVAEGSLTQTVHLLRKALGKLPDGSEFIETIPKKGYRLSQAAVDPSRARAVESGELNQSLGIDANSLYKLVVESIEDYAIYTLDLSGRVLTWNRGAEKNKGFSGREVIGRHYSLFFTPEDVEARVPEREMAIAATTGSCSGTGWRVRSNGERFWASYSLTALRSANGKLIGYAKILKDLTERKREEDALRKSESSARRERERLIATAESIDEALLICEPVEVEHDRHEIEDFVFTFLNRKVDDLFTIPGRDLLGGRMTELLPVNVELGLFEEYKKVAQTGVPFTATVAVHDAHVKSNRVRFNAAKYGNSIAITAADLHSNEQQLPQLWL
jgi:PAS domain S-box-containing protein